MTPLDVTQIAAPAPVGGAESVVAELARGLARRGHRSRVVALLGLDPAADCLAFAGLEADGVELHVVRLPGRSYREESRRVAGLLAPTDTLAHCHGYHADVVGWRAARRAGRSLVSTVHGFTAGSWKNRLYEWIDHRVLASFDAVVAVSAPLRERLAGRGLARSKVHLIPNAVPASPELLARGDARAALGLPLDAPVVGWIGRLSPEKGPDLFLEAVARLPAGVLASVIGSGALAESLKARATALGLDDRVWWHGTVPAAGRLLRAFDLVALSSRTEGTPMVLLEAMGAGVPVVATAVGGVPDVAPGGEALLVPPRGQELADAIRASLERPAEAAERAARARTRAATAYGVDAWLDRHEQLYRSLG